jgi:hypothetical protein
MRPTGTLAAERPLFADASQYSLHSDAMPTAFGDYYRCAPGAVEFEAPRELTSRPGYFRFSGAVCYGRVAAASPASRPDAALPDVTPLVRVGSGRLTLPFDLSEIVTNLRREQYGPASAGFLQTVLGSRTPRRVYYALRPALPVGVRKYLQRVALNGWERIAFPRWPLDVTVDDVMEGAVKIALQCSGLPRLPFVWFWPDGAPGCAIITHDVESRSGRDFCDRVMDLDLEYGVRGAVQIVPESRYEVSDSFLESIRGRGFEVNVHDLNHDGRLFERRSTFLARAARINRYVAAFGSRGFRAGAMYRNQDWLEALDVSYDMSVPNVAHLDAQPGGCCTVMPYFMGHVLELPLTTVQDYALFHILGDYSIDLWKSQTESILSRHGLASFVAHPDYLTERRALHVYEELLAHLSRLRDDGCVWLTLPGEVDRWWRSRSRMRLVPSGRSWRIEGPDSERARLAYATLEDGRLVYEVETPAVR